MRKVIVTVLVSALVLGIAAASIVRVPASGGAWCRGRYLGPGVQLKRPFSRAVPYPPGDLSAAVKKGLRSSDGDTVDFSFEVSYRWDFRRLPTEPINPRTLDDRLLDRLEQIDGLHAAGEIGSRAEAQLRQLLVELPVVVTTAHAEFRSPAFEALRQAARPTGEKLVIVGLDGFDWGLLDRLIGEGRCPTFAEMKRTGAWGEIVSRPPVLSPLIWTTMGTGRLPEDHGIADFVVTDSETGADVPITNQSRRVHAFWNLLSYVDRTVNVVNWWATYPAESINGVMVSERVFYQLFGISPALDDPANISPPEVAPSIIPLLVEADDIGYEEVAGYAAITRADYERALEAARLAENPFDDRINHLRKIIAVTRGVFNTSRWLLDNRPADVLVLYVEGTDTVGHRFAHFLPPRLGWVDRQDFDRYHETMARYYETVDTELGELMRHAPPDTTWIVVADHGFYTGAARPSVPPDDFTVGAPQWHRMVGVFLASGPLVRPGKIPYVHIDDLCRTILWLEGVPISRRLQGRELTAMIDPGWAAAHPPIPFDGYDELPLTWLGRATTSLLDEARMQELRALGYLADEPATAEPRGGEGGPPPPSGPTEGKVTEPYNLAKIAQRRGQLDEAERLYLEAIEIEPNFAIGMVSLAGVYSAKGDHVESLRWILRALETGGDTIPPLTLLDLVREAEATGRLERILPVFDMIRPRWESTSTFYTARGQTLLALGRTDEAVAEFRAALDRDPGDPVATEELMALAARGVAVDTEEILDQHLQAVWNDLKKLNDLAVVCLRQRQPQLAERALRRVLDSDPTNPGVVSNLAIALQMQGKRAEALELFEGAVAARPDDATLQFNLGAMLASFGRNERALEHLEASQRLGNSGARLYVAKSKVLVRVGRVDDARVVLEEGARRHPDDAEIRDLLAVLQGSG